VEGALDISVYPGADGSFLLYEDNGSFFDFRKGEWMGIQMDWDDVLSRPLSGRAVLTMKFAFLVAPFDRAVWADSHDGSGFAVLLHR
jgi:Domain of unknown function (DUF5110)